MPADPPAVPQPYIKAWHQAVHEYKAIDMPDIMMANTGIAGNGKPILLIIYRAFGPRGRPNHHEEPLLSGTGMMKISRSAR